MKKIITIVVISVLAIGCASVEKNKVDERKEITTETKQGGNEKIENISETSEKSEAISVNEHLNFSIVPETGKIADFNFNYGGKLISGSTTGSLNFSNQKTETKTKVVTKTYTIEKKIRYWYTIKKTQIIYRIKTKTKEITVDYPWYFWAVLIPLIIISWELLKKYIPINFLRLIEK